MHWRVIGAKRPNAPCAKMNIEAAVERRRRKSLVRQNNKMERELDFISKFSSMLSHQRSFCPVFDVAGILRGNTGYGSSAVLWHYRLSLFCLSYHFLAVMGDVVRGGRGRAISAVRPKFKISSIRAFVAMSFVHNSLRSHGFCLKQHFFDHHPFNEEVFHGWPLSLPASTQDSLVTFCVMLGQISAI